MMRKSRKRNACLAALERMREWRKDLALNDVLAFLYVCENEGITVRELAHLARLDQSTGSRTAARLAGGRDRLTAGGEPLIELRARQDDLRARALALTGLGVSLRDEIDAIILQAHPIRQL